MSKRCSASYERVGLTLIEVIAGLALLSTLLVAILIAFRGHALQVRASQDRLAAIAHADRLLLGWTAEEQLPPVGARGLVTDEWSWRIAPAESAEAPWPGTRVVRLEIIDSGGDERPHVLTAVELLVEGSKPDLEVQ